MPNPPASPPIAEAEEAEVAKLFHLEPRIGDATVSLHNREMSSIVVLPLAHGLLAYWLGRIEIETDIGSGPFVLTAEAMIDERVDDLCA